MATKKGATSATKTQDKPKTYKRISDALTGFDDGEMQRGTTMVVGPTHTAIQKSNPNAHKEYFRFEGSPAQFVAHLMKHVIGSKLKVEIVEPDPDASPTTG